MFRERILEFWVGLFLLLGLVALVILAFKVSGLSGYISAPTYRVVAYFDDVGGLKIRSPVTMAGVRVGEVSGIVLNAKNFKAKVTMKLLKWANTIPSDSVASIFTEGLLGANYISLTPGFADTYWHQGSIVEETHSALILENLIGQFLYSTQKKDQNQK